MFTTIFSSRGIRMGFSIPNLSLRAGAISSLYLSFNIAIYVLPVALGNPDLLSRLREPVADLGRLPGGWIYHHHVRDVHGGREGVEPLLVVLGRPGVAGADIDAAHDHAVLPGDDPLDLPALALLLAGDNHHGVPALYLETHLEHLRGQRDDPRVALLPELACDGPEDARPARRAVWVNDNPGVLAEADVRPVVAARLLLGPNHHGPHHVALLDTASRGSLLDGGHDHIPDAGAPAPAAAEHADSKEAPSPRVVRDPYPRLLLDHYSALETMFASRQRLRAEMGRVSMILTVSPTRASLPSSCTMKRLECRTRFLYTGWRTSVSTETVTVFSGLSETTSPTRSLRLPRSGSLWILPSSWSSAGPLAGPRSSPASTVSPPSTRLSTVSSGLASPVSSEACSVFLSSSTTIRSPASFASGRSGAGRCSSGPP